MIILIIRNTDKCNRKILSGKFNRTTIIANEEEQNVKTILWGGGGGSWGAYAKNK